MPHQITYAFALPGKRENTEIAFFTQMLYQCIARIQPRFNQLLLDFFCLSDSRLILTLLYDSLNHVVNALSSGLLGAWFRRKEVERAAAFGLCCTHSACAPMRCLSERKKCHL